MNAIDGKIVRATQAGLPLVPQPYAEVARSIGISEEALLSRLKAMLRKAGERTVSSRNAAGSPDTAVSSAAARTSKVIASDSRRWPNGT